MIRYKQICSFLFALVVLGFLPARAHVVQQRSKLVGTHVMSEEYPKVPDFLPKGFPGFDVNGTHPNPVSATSIDSVKKRVLAGQTKIHSKKTILSNGQVVVEIYQTWADSVWVNSTKDSSTSDSHGEVIDDVTENWNDNAWVNSTQVMSTYDVNENVTNLLHRTWSGSAWVNVTQDSYSYDGNGYRTNLLHQIWNVGAWVNSYQENYTYDANGHGTGIVYQTWNGSAWVNAFQFSFTYTPGSTSTVLCSTNAALPLASWNVLGSVTDIPPGSGFYQFTDLQATNLPRCFYCVRSP